MSTGFLINHTFYVKTLALLCLTSYYLAQLSPFSSAVGDQQYQFFVYLHSSITCHFHTDRDGFLILCQKSTVTPEKYSDCYFPTKNGWEPSVIWGSAKKQTSVSILMILFYHSVDWMIWNGLNDDFIFSLLGKVSPQIFHLDFQIQIANWPEMENYQLKVITASAYFHGWAAHFWPH